MNIFLQPLKFLLAYNVYSVLYLSCHIQVGSVIVASISCLLEGIEMVIEWPKWRLGMNITWMVDTWEVPLYAKTGSNGVSSYPNSFLIL